MQIKWRKLPKKPLHCHRHINNDDICIYSREYISEGYTASQTNSLILNFKKSPSKKANRSEWTYRQQAIEQFKNEIETLFKQDLSITITALPSSKHKTDSEYDKRFEDLFKELLKSRPLLKVEWPVEIKETSQASHLGGERNPADIKKNYIWKKFEDSRIKRLCVFDDVLTTGAHFRAISDFLRENGYTGKIIGIFWARVIQN